MLRMNLFRKICLALFSFIQVVSVFSQKVIVPAGKEVNFTLYSKAEGLPSNHISKIFQTKRGYIAACTSQGFTLFDGISFKKYTKKDGLPDNSVMCGAEDENNCIWLGSQYGLSVMKNGKVTYYDSTYNNMPNNIVWCIFKDIDGTLWAGSGNGIYHLNPKAISNPLIKHYKTGKGAQNNIRSIIRTTYGELLAGCDIGGYCFKNDSFIVNTERTFVNTIYEVRPGTVWYCGWGNNVYQYTKNKLDTVYRFDTYIMSVTSDKKGNVWMASWDKGIYKYDWKKFTNYTIKEGLPANVFWSCVTDKEGNIWLGNWGQGGLIKYSGEKFTRLTEKQGLLNNMPIKVIEDKSNNIWIGFINGVTFYNLSNYSTTNFTSCDNKPFSQITSIGLQSNNDIWLQGYSEYQYKISNGKTSMLNLHGGFCFLEDSKNNIWMGSDGNGAYRHNLKGEFQKFTAIDKFRVNRILSIYEDKAGNFWFLNTLKGINFCNLDTTIHLSSKNGFFDERANSISEYKQGKYWVSINGKGLYLFTINEDFKVTVHDSIIILENGNALSLDAPVFHKNKMYIGSEKGLYIYTINPKTLKYTFLKYYDKDDGFVSDGCNVSLIDSKGNIWLTTSQGVYCYNPYYEFRNTTETNTYLNDIKLFFENVNWENYTDSISEQTNLPHNLNLPYYQNHLTFNFTGICHTAQAKVLYKYKLQGLDKNWSPPSRKNEATYSNIPPGTYTFMVTSCNNDGIWNTNPTLFTFTVTPPFWQRIWFYVLCGIIITSGIYTYIKIREKTLKKEKQILEEKINQRTLQLKIAFQEIEEKNKEITDSINYSKRIQSAILPNVAEIQKSFPESFVFYCPKDIVSGDFYWFYASEETRLIAVVDCTGHGVPGAFMSLVGKENLDKAVEQSKEPGEILSILNNGVKKSLNQNQADGTKDGMDIVLCSFSKNKLKYAGANRPLWIIKQNSQTINQLNPEKSSIAGSTPDNQTYKQHEITLEKEDSIYLFSDGYADQFGGQKQKKLTTKNMKQLLIDINQKNMIEQKQHLTDFINKWKGSNEQVDDICIIGIRGN